MLQLHCLYSFSTFQNFSGYLFSDSLFISYFHKNLNNVGRCENYYKKKISGKHDLFFRNVNMRGQNELF